MRFTTFNICLLYLNRGANRPCVKSIVYGLFWPISMTAIVYDTKHGNGRYHFIARKPKHTIDNQYDIHFCPGEKFNSPN
jgi:hypothetical protein